MATGKRYYWIKLKESFLASDAVDFLMSQKPDGTGANYVVLYQMLCLKTINTGGRLERHIGEVVIPYDEAKIQRDTKWFSIDTIRVALNLYKALGLVYVDKDGTLALTDHENLVGSETDWAAQKKTQRQGQLSLPSVDNVHNDVRENVHTEIENRDKEIRDRDQILEKEVLTEPVGSVCRTKDVRRVVDEWNKLGLQQVQKVTSDSKRGGMLRARVNEYGVEKVIEAIGKVRESDFLKGQNDNGWVITFEWFVKPNNFVKILEGNYDNRTSSKRPRSRYYTTAEEYERPAKIDTEKLAMLEENMKRNKKTD
ncbi:MAG: phage replisome organizer N-terminal domain-containing protein [Oscillospiraceae bacterium]|nr:phage replisome organizer N-terminal domain-containing protein [Oscillospiraceae bacterium]